MGNGRVWGRLLALPLDAKLLCYQSVAEGAESQGQGGASYKFQTFAKVYHAEYNLATSEIH